MMTKPKNDGSGSDNCSSCCNSCKNNTTKKEHHQQGRLKELSLHLSDHDRDNGYDNNNNHYLSMFWYEIQFIAILLRSQRCWISVTFIITIMFLPNVAPSVSLLLLLLLPLLTKNDDRIQINLPDKINSPSSKLVVVPSR